MTSDGQHHAPSWFDISTPDSRRTQRFYQEVFGWPVHALDETYALVGAPDSLATGGIGQSGADSPYTGIVVYFPVDDVERALERAERLGARRTMEPRTTPMGQIAVFTDLDGNHIGVTSHR
ncbi:VOC family protein [Nocardia stercoris]|uniref:VOC family protein n=1 Tax=Nocardia stercoris TaxID=2483361 RepID=A0A3M2L6A5_9NOCA|nr:VOC family protein [Nocardia stercoris]RMI31445.1 VOC family protein [Nocardia stercoris]